MSEKKGYWANPDPHGDKDPDHGQVPTKEELELAIDGAEMEPEGTDPSRDMVHDVKVETPKGRLYTIHHRLCHDAFELMVKKNHDYASLEDPYRNFRLFGKFGILVRLGDKFARLRSFEEQGELKVDDESIKDTLLDIINYCVLYYGYED